MLSLLVGLALALTLFAHWHPPLFQAAFTVTCGAVFFLSWKAGHRPSWPLVLAAGIIGVSAWLSVPGSVWWGQGHWVLSLSVALWATPSLFLALSRPRRVGTVLAWLSPAVLAHAGAIIYQGAILRELRPSGLMHNPNLAAGLLVLGVVYLMPTRYRMLVVPLLVALPFTGSRWASIVCVGLVLGMIAIQGYRWWRPLVITMAIIAAMVWITWYVIPSAYRLMPTPIESLERYTDDAEYRLRFAPAQLRLTGLPQGVNDSDGLHNVLVRVAVEWGVLAAAAWLYLTAQGLRYGLKTPAWWVLTGVVALGLLDYYPMMPHFAGFWWLLVGRSAGLTGWTTARKLSPTPETATHAA